MYVLQLFQSPKCYSISIYIQPFSSCRLFSDKCTTWSLNDHQELKGTLYTFCFYLKSHISILFIWWPAVFDLQAILRQVDQMTQKTVNTTRSKVPTIWSTTAPSPNFNIMYFNQFHPTNFYQFSTRRVNYFTGYCEQSMPLSCKVQNTSLYAFPI